MSATTSESSTPTGRASALRWAWFGLALSLFLVGAKWAAFYLTGSAAILSDAIESGVNVLSSSFLLFAIWLSHQPRDADHPYGHGRVEYFSAGFEGALVLGAAVSIAMVGLSRLLTPVELGQLGLGAILQGIIAVVTFAAGQSMILAGRRHRSPSLEADGIHFRSDAITSLGTGLGVAIVWATQIEWLDAAAAIAVAVWLGWSGVSVMREAVGGLMDEADMELLDEIGETLEAVRRPGWIAPHHAKVHHLGRAIHVDLHMVFPAYWELERAHACSERIEGALAERFGPSTDVMVHMESCTPQSCSYCDVEDCPIRQEPFVRRHRWDAAHISAMHRAEPVGADEEAGDEVA